MYDHSHVEEVYSVTDANREHLRVWLPWVDGVKSADDTRAFIRKALEQFARDDGFHAGVWEDGKYVGGVGFHWINRNNGFTEIGYWLARSAEGRGIMTAACRSMINHAFSIWKLNKVEIRCAGGNHRSRAVPKRLGFTEEGTLRQINKIGSTYHDIVVYGMLAGEWQRRSEMNSQI